MQCDFCDKKATVFLTQLVEGEMKKMCLCEECAEEKAKHGRIIASTNPNVRPD